MVMEHHFGSITKRETKKIAVGIYSCVSSIIYSCVCLVQGFSYIFSDVSFMSRIFCTRFQVIYGIIPNLPTPLFSSCFQSSLYDVFEMKYSVALHFLNFFGRRGKWFGAIFVYLTQEFGSLFFMRPCLLHDHYHIRYMSFKWWVSDCHHLLSGALLFCFTSLSFFPLLFYFPVSDNGIALWGSVEFLLILLYHSSILKTVLWLEFASFPLIVAILNQELYSSLKMQWEWNR